MSHPVEPAGGNSGAPADESLGQLISQVTNDVSTLVRDEMQLAKVEIQQTVKDAGMGAGLFGGAGVVALYGVGALIATLILVLALLMPAWLAALIVTIVLFAVAAGLALFGKKKVEQATPPVEAVKANVAKDKQAIKGVKA